MNFCFVLFALHKSDASMPINPYVYKKCRIRANSPKYSYFFQRIFTWIDASTQVILPFMIMVICNVNIIYKVLLNKSKTNGKNLKRLRKIKGMCVMIVSVSVIFFVLEAPVLIFICFGIDQSEWDYTDLVWTIINLMMYTNHVINFFSYCMTGTKFRRELLRILLIHETFKSFNTLFFNAKTNQPTNAKCKNMDRCTVPNFSHCEATNFAKARQTEMELKDVNKPLVDGSTNKKSSLTNLIIARKAQLSASESASTNGEIKNTTIRKLVMGKIKVNVDFDKSSEVSGSISSITQSMPNNTHNHTSLLKRFTYKKNTSLYYSSTYLAKTVCDLDKINIEEDEKETSFKI